MNDDDITALKAHFEAARSHAARPSEALLARVLADAMQIQEEQAETPAPQGRAPAHEAGFWRQVFQGLGGWPALTGLATATVVGIWIGASPPSGLEGYLAEGEAAFVVDLDPWDAFDLASVIEGAM